jgi:hypothetical protein
VKGHEGEMHTLIHDMLAERAALQQQVTGILFAVALAVFILRDNL